MSYNPKDHFFHKAKKDGFAARSVYKLEEIDKKYKIFRSGQNILDLGAAPGSWSQYACQKIGGGKLLGIDLTPIKLSLPQAHFIAMDLYDFNLAALQELGFTEPFDVVMSDMAPNTTGIKSVDQARSTGLCELALETARRTLRPGGTFICKFFQSGDFQNLRTAIRKEFDRVEVVKPQSTRSISKEIFIVGLKRQKSDQAHA